MYMRKKKRLIKDTAEVVAILQEEKVVRVAFAKNNQPYIVPMNYGYADRKIFCHTGHEGMKIEWLKANPRVCVEVDRGIQIISGKLACQYSCQYESVIGFGSARLVDDDAEKRRALNVIMAQIAGGTEWEFNEEILKLTAILEITLTEIVGRRSKN